MVELLTALHCYSIAFIANPLSVLCVSLCVCVFVCVRVFA